MAGGEEASHGLVPDDVGAADRVALDRMFSETYEQLRRLAATVKRDDPSATLSPTALVNEAWIKLAGSPAVAHTSPLHFKRIAARAMRQVLVEAARRKQTAKHGGGRQRQDLDAEAIAAPAPDLDLLALDAALERLAEHDPLKARLVELRYFAGLTGDQAAAVLGLSPSSADRQWVFTRAWLRRELGFSGES